MIIESDSVVVKDNAFAAASKSFKKAGTKIDQGRMDMSKFIRHLHNAEKVIFVDGLWGTGKPILGPVLGTFRNVEKQRLEHIYEYLSILYNFKKIDSDAAVTLMRLYADLALFNLLGFNSPQLCCGQ